MGRHIPIPILAPSDIFSTSDTIGYGATGSVQRAHYLGAPVAIKFTNHYNDNGDDNVDDGNNSAKKCNGPQNSWGRMGGQFRVGAVEGALLMNEAKVLCGIRHPCIVECYGVVEIIDDEGFDSKGHSEEKGETGKERRWRRKAKRGLVMEEMDETLFHVLHKSRKNRTYNESLESKVVLKVASLIVEGVRMLHKRGWVWGDAKSLNCLVRRWGTDDVEVKLADMDLARWVGSDQTFGPHAGDGGEKDGLGVGKENEKSGKPTEKKTWEKRERRTWLPINKGTLAYLAPEAWRGHSYSHHPLMAKASDVYAVAVILYELLTLQKPWKGSNGWDVYRAVVEEGKRPKWPCGHESWVGWRRRIKDLVQRCWHGEWDKRPCISQIARELEQVKATPMRIPCISHIPQKVEHTEHDPRDVKDPVIDDEHFPPTDYNKTEQQGERDQKKHVDNETYRGEKMRGQSSNSKALSKSNALSPYVLAKFDQDPATGTSNGKALVVPVSPVSSRGSDTTLSISSFRVERDLVQGTVRVSRKNDGAKIPRLQHSTDENELTLSDVSANESYE